MSVKDIFDSLSYGPAPESAAPALDWIAAHGGRFGHWIDGRFTPAGETFATRNPVTGELLAEVTQGSPADVAAAVAAARRAQGKWGRTSGHERARVLYALGRLVQKHARLFAVLETLDTGKPIREARDADIPLVARHFGYHAGLAQLVADELPGMAPVGVCAAVVPWNFPLLMLAWKVAPALAAGNTVVLKPAEWTPLSALLFAELAREAGLPKGVLNVVTGDGATGTALVAHPDVAKVAFTGSTATGRDIRTATAGTGKGLTLELGGKGPFIVFEDADLDSAVEGLVEGIWFNGGQVCCAGSRLLVQEGVAGDFLARLERRMARLRVGDPLDKCIDIGALADPAHLARVTAMVAATQGEVFRPDIPIPPGCFCAPTLVTGLTPADPLMQEEVFGPVLAATTFRTHAEAVEIANNTRYGLAASVWTENVNMAHEVAGRLRVGVVWVNAANLFDAAAGFGGVRESGFGREGGWEGLRPWLRPAVKPRPLRAIAPAPAPAAPVVEGIDRTAKLYIGGKQVRPDSGLSRAVWSPRGRLLGHVGLGTRKDIRNAVESARAAAAGWARASAWNRAQVIYYLAENLSARADEFAARLRDLTGKPGAAEVESAIRRLFTCAAWADKWEGAVKPVPLRGMVATLREPQGVIGAICPDEAPLLGLVSLLAPAMAVGNACVLVPSRAYPLAATDFYQLLDTSDVPGGVANIVTGDVAELARTLAGHMDVDAVWAFAGADLSALVERESVANLKRTWVDQGQAMDWTAVGARPFLEAATDIKTLWLPAGM